MSKVRVICPVVKIQHTHGLKHHTDTLRPCRVDLTAGTITYTFDFMDNLQQVKIMPECTVKTLLIANYKINHLKFT